MDDHYMNRFRSIAALLIACTASSAFADAPAITPYRPTVSNSAQLPAAGQLELEMGVLSAKSDDERRVSVPILFKLALNDQWGILLGGDSLVVTRNNEGMRNRSVGDFSVVIKRAFLIEEGTAAGVEWSVKVPSATHNTGTGKADYTLNTILSKDIGDFHLDANANVMRLGAYEADTGRIQTGLSAALSTALSEKWSGVVELSGARRSSVPGSAQLLVAASYSASKRLTLDFGITHGLTPSAVKWSVFSGLVVPIAKLW